MFDATRVLGSMLEHRSTPSAAGRLGNAIGQGSLGAAGGPLQQILAQFGGGSASGGGLGGLLGTLGGSGGGLTGLLGGLTGRLGGQAGGLSGQLTEMARQAASSPGQELGRNNPVAVGGLGALAGTLLGGGRGTVGGGLLAVLGSLAYSALQADRSASQGGSGNPGTITQASGYARPTSAIQPAVHDEAPATPEDVQRMATLVLRSMIQASKADGQMDSREIERITGKLDEAGDDPEARSFVLTQMRAPLDIESLVRDVRTPKEAAEIYAASLMAIEVDTQAEKDYLERLAVALGLSQVTVGYIHNSLSVSTQGPPAKGAGPTT